MKYDREFCWQRLNDLHPIVFAAEPPSIVKLLAYFEYQRIWNTVFDLGRDMSDHPRNPFRK